MKSEFDKDKAAIRECVLQAIKLHQEERIDIEVLRTIAESALAWEITTNYERKFSRKLREFEDRIHQ